MNITHLQEPTRSWCKVVAQTFDLEPHEVRLLVLAGEAWDRGQQSREVLEQHGLTFTDRFGQPRARPEVAIERDSRIAFARLVRELGLDTLEIAGARPPHIPVNAR